MANQSSTARFAKNSIPVSAGIGLKFEHINQIIEHQPEVGWFEVHAENFMREGGPSIRALEMIRKNYPISLHGVGLSIGGDEPLDKGHIDRLKKLIDWLEPGLVSEHLAWSNFNGTFFNDLLPLPYVEETLHTIVRHVDQLQDLLKRQILIENPSLYLTYNNADLSEPHFLKEIAARTGCGLLLDVNNVYVSASNLGFDPGEYLAEFDLRKVKEIHLAGHHQRKVGDKILRIDDHGSRVSEDVWNLYEGVLNCIPPVPTLIEWDTNIPPFKTLEIEATIAQKHMERLGVTHACIS